MRRHEAPEYHARTAVRSELRRDIEPGTRRFPAAGRGVCLWVILTSGCALLRGGDPPPDARVHVLSLTDLPHGDALDWAATVLEDLDGVYRARPDLARAELTVFTKPGVTAGPLLTALGRLTAVAEQGRGRYRPPASFPPDADVRVLTLTGRDVEDLAPHVAAGRITVFDFYADWCMPCKKLDRTLQRVVGMRNDVAIRKLNIVDFNSALAQRYVKRSIPMIVIYNRSGHMIASLSGSDPDKLAAAIGQATISKE